MKQPDHYIITFHNFTVILIKKHSLGITGKRDLVSFLRTDHTNFVSFHHLALDRHAQFDERTHLHIPVTLSAVCQGGIALIRVCTFV